MFLVMHFLVLQHMPQKIMNWNTEKFKFGSEYYSLTVFNLFLSLSLSLSLSLFLSLYLSLSLSLSLYLSFIKTCWLMLSTMKSNK